MARVGTAKGITADTSTTEAHVEVLKNTIRCHIVTSLTATWQHEHCSLLSREVGTQPCHNTAYEVQSTKRSIWAASALKLIKTVYKQDGGSLGIF